MPTLHQTLSLHAYNKQDLHCARCVHPRKSIVNTHGAVSGRTSQADVDDWLTIYCPVCNSDNTFYNDSDSAWWCASCLVEFEYGLLTCPICESAFLRAEGVNGVSVSYPPVSSDRGDMTPNFRIVCYACSAEWDKSELDQLLTMVNQGV